MAKFTFFGGAPDIWQGVKNVARGVGNFFALKDDGGRGTRRGYEGAGRGARTGSFPQNGLSANKDIGMSAEKLRQRARYLYQNTVYAKRAINGLGNAISGLGIIPTFKVTRKGGTADMTSEAALQAAWEEWGEKIYCDFGDKMDFYGLTNLVAKTFKRDGECMVLRRRVPVSMSPNGLQLQVLEMEYLADYINYQVLPGGGWTMNGIQYSKWGKVEGYWLFSRHPSEWYTVPELYPAKDVIHLFSVNFPAQGRGVPAGAPTIVTERDLGEYEDAELMAKKVQASHAIFRITNDPEKMTTEPDPEDYDKNEDLEKVEPGSIYHLFPGEQIQSNTPPTSPGTEDYRKSKHRNIAMGYEVSYEMLTGDYSEVNFSSGRMGRQEFLTTIGVDQWLIIIPQFCNRVAEWFLENVPLTPGSELTAITGKVKVSWTTPAVQMIDPVKETNAIKNKLRSGLMSWTEAIKQMGDNPELVLKQIAADIELFKKMGVNSEWCPNLDLDIATPAKMKGEASRAVEMLEEVLDRLGERER